MQYIFLLLFSFTLSYSDILSINSFEADFNQTITDEKGKVLQYQGHVSSMKPKFALWSYLSPIKKDIYIQQRVVTIVEPEIEQVIIKHISSDYDFFTIIQNAKKIEKNKYLALFQEHEYTIELLNSKIHSISYKDEFDNETLILFSKQQQNEKIAKEVFIPKYSLEYDIIQE